MSTENRLINFNAGPAMLPEEVLDELAVSVKSYKGSGMSVLEIPHRGKLFGEILDESRELVRRLCRLDEHYEILWLAGGGRLQFAMIPMNFLPEDGSASYVDSGKWADEAASYAGFYGNVHIAASSRSEDYTRFPVITGGLPSGTSYVHITTNNTIYGTQCRSLPQTSVPLIADMSSDILSRETNYGNCAVFYATAQKNLGAAGVTLTAVHRDMLQRSIRRLPPMLDYREHVKHGSVLNTPPVSAIYTSLLMLRWIEARGTDTIFRDNLKKAATLYAEIERNSCFLCRTDPGSRSMMNIVFTGRDRHTENSFLTLCRQNGITGIEGHRSVGAFRVSLYNSIKYTDVQKLVSCMQELEHNQT